MKQHQIFSATPGHHAQYEECTALPEFLLFLLEFRHADHLHSTCPHRQSENDLGVGLPKTKTHNHTYCYLVHLSGYTAPHTNCIYNLIYILHWLGFVWTWVHPKSTREIVTFPIKIAILWEYPHFQTHQCGGLTNKTKKTKSNPGTRATPMTHRMVGKIWKICRRKLGKQLLGLEPSQEQFSSTTDASSASWSHFDLNCCFNLVYFCCKTVVPVWSK